MQEYPMAIRACDAAFELNPGNLKIVLRRAKASSLNGDFDDALTACKMLLESVDAHDLLSEVSALMDLTKRRETAAKHKQKTQFNNFFER
jgi:hypothetical protein